MKKIFFLADSLVDLKFLYTLLKKKYEINWVYYHKNLKSDLLKLDCDNNKLFFLHTNTFILILKKILSKFGLLKINYEREALKKINIIDKKYKPDLWITDTGNLLSQIDLNAPKATFKHSVPYKKFFLSENTYKYDYVFVPGFYHYKRILSYYPNKFAQFKKKLKISVSPKIFPYINIKNKKKIFFQKTHLNKKKKLFYWLRHMMLFLQKDFYQKILKMKV